MNITNILLASAEYAVIIPAALMCIFPVMHYNKVSNKLLLPIMTVVMLAASLFCGILKIKFSFDTNILMIPLMLLALVLYFILFTQNKIKMWYIFISVTAVFSFSGLSGYIIEAIVNKNGNTEDLQTYGLLIQWILIIIFLVACILIITKIKWLMDNYHINSIWKFVWLIPAFITTANIIMIPQDYSIVGIGRLFEIYIVSNTLLLLLYILFQVMLYIIAKAITDKTSAEQQSQILSIQATEYENLKKYIENTSQLRHDFLHTARTASQLAKNNDYETLIKLLDCYGISVENSQPQKIFCKHNALNAIVGYYYEEALKHNIKCNWKIDISNNISVSDIDLCSVTGNLLDNAIHGCLTVDEISRYINFNADIEKNGDIYIVVTNSFNGIVKKENDKYISNKANGNGIGLESINTTVKKHNGYVKFYNDKKNFYSDIMIKQDY